MYLIMKYEALNDQYECEADRTPIAITGDWRDWINNNPNFTDSFEVYKWENNTMTLVRNAWGDGIESDEYGMAFYYWINDQPNEPPTVIERWPGLTRHDPMPHTIETDIRYHLKYHSKDETWEEVLDDIHSGGFYDFFEGDRFYAYGEYEGNQYTY